MMSASQAVVDFASLAIQSGGYMELDRLYVQNRVLGLIGETALEQTTPSATLPNSLTLLDALIEVAQKNQIIDDTSSQREILEGQLMDFLTPPPSVVNALFSQRYGKDKVDATNYFYKLSKENDYIKTRAIAKNSQFTVDTDYGTLEITINLSKPEKDPKQIALEKNAETVNYPKCMLCFENEGYLGRTNYPARTNHRIIRMNIEGESWGFQYSPYAYYNEHCIFLAEEHRPMVITEKTFQRLLSIVEIFPHYFAGSNADLPIVGGSILSHDHYQGGRHTFPMATAPMERLFKLTKHPEVVAGIVKWPMSVIRLQSSDRAKLVAAALEIFNQWQDYTDSTVDVVAHSEDGTPHHTVTPIARKKADFFELDIVLRDNNVSAEFPDGIFHPHPALHHIKKENIGLIEVMGLAILPPRLKTELAEVADYLLGNRASVAPIHQVWADELKAQKNYTAENVEAEIQAAVGQIFLAVLEDAGVFKRNAQGGAAFQRFTDSL